MCRMNYFDKHVAHVLAPPVETSKWVWSISHPFEQTRLIILTVIMSTTRVNMDDYTHQFTLSMCNPCIGDSCRPMAGERILLERTLLARLVNFFCLIAQMDGAPAMNAGE